MFFSMTCKIYSYSGGNDNKLFVWNLSAQTPMQTYTEHLAAVKVSYLFPSLVFKNIRKYNHNCYTNL